MSEIEIFGFAPSTYVRSARMACVLSGAPYELKPLAFKEPSHFALHPFGRMPIMRHEDVTLFESLAIITYIDDVFNGGRLQPDAPAEHARMVQWASAAIDYLYPALVGGLLADQVGDPEVTAAAEALSKLDAALGEEGHLVAGVTTLADLLCFPMVAFALTKLDASKAAGLARLRRFHATLDTTPAGEETRA